MLVHPINNFVFAGDLEEAQLRLVEERRSRLLDLAAELDAGAVRHRFESRASSLNSLRLDAVRELRTISALPDQDKELPGPAASEWIHWLCNLPEEHYSTVFEGLRQDFPALEAFTVEMEESYWTPGEGRGDSPAAAPLRVPEPSPAGRDRQALLDPHVPARLDAGASGDGFECAPDKRVCVEAFDEQLGGVRELEAVGSQVGMSVLCPGAVATGIMNSAKHWPDRLGPAPAPPDDVSYPQLDELMTSEQVAAITFEAIAARRPLLLKLEDIHWSDTSTLDWLAHVARRPEPARLMLLATFRPADAAAIKAGLGGVVWSGVGKPGIAIVLSPLIGFRLALILMLAVSWIFVRTAPYTVDRNFRMMQFISASLISLGHGGNDAQKTMGIIAVLLYSQGYLGTEFSVPYWVVLACQASMALGTLMGGWRIVRTMGLRITKLTPMQGFCAETGGAATLFMATYLGVPVSTTHTITGAIVGVGSSQKMSAVRWGVAGNIVWAWIFTIPASAFIAAIRRWVGPQIM